MKKVLSSLMPLIILITLAACGSIPSDAPTLNTPPSDTLPSDEPKVDFYVQYIRTNGGIENAAYPITTVIASANELNQYYDNYKDACDLERREKIYSDTTIGFLDAVEGYTDDFFSNSYLMIVMLGEPSGSIRHHVESADKNSDIVISRLLPEVGTDDEAQWSIIIELDNAFSPEEFSVTLVDKKLY